MEEKFNQFLKQLKGNNSKNSSDNNDFQYTGTAPNGELIEIYIAKNGNSSVKYSITTAITENIHRKNPRMIYWDRNKDFYLKTTEDLEKMKNYINHVLYATELSDKYFCNIPK